MNICEEHGKDVLVVHTQGFRGCPVCNGSVEIFELKNIIEGLEDDIYNKNVEIRNLSAEITNLESKIEDLKDDV